MQSSPDKNTPRAWRRYGAILLALAACAPAQAELVLEGLNEEQARNVRLFSALADEPCDAPHWLLRRRYRNLEQEIARALEPYGYYRPQIESTLELDGDCWLATAAVTPGEPVLYRNIDVRITGPGSDDSEFAEARQRARFETGRRLRHDRYEQFKRDLQLVAAERGYFDSAFEESRIDVWPDDLAADLSLEFATGDRYAFGEINQQQNFLDPGLVAGFLDLEPGAPFSQSELARAHSDLSDSGYFGRIDLDYDIEAASNGRVPLTVKLDPGTRIEYTIGAGASTDTGPRLRAGFRNTRLNNSGHRVKADLNVSTLLQALSSEYRIPLADPRSEWMSFNTAVSREKTDTFENRVATAGVRRTRQINPSWIGTLGLGLNYESFRVADESEDTFLVLPSVSLDNKVASSDLYADRGRRFTVELTGTSDAIGSSTSFMQITAWASWVRTLGMGFRFIARGSVGHIETNDFDRLPPSVRYFAGGDQSVRGFDFESLGPTNADGEVIGGTDLLVLSGELERQIRGNFYGAVFVDAGNAYNGDEFDPAVGAGLGIKWRSPVGPIRLYVGFPVDEDDGNPRLHLRLGAEL